MNSLIVYGVKVASFQYSNAVVFACVIYENCWHLPWMSLVVKFENVPLSVYVTLSLCECQCMLDISSSTIYSVPNQNVMFWYIRQVLIEGNIASGKTEFMEHFKNVDGIQVM